MALGQKLGGILSGVGMGLSFVPGPWSAIGAALTIGGQVAGQVGEAKDRKEADREREQQTNQPEPAQPIDASRPEQTQIAPNQNQPVVQPPSRNVLQPQQPNLGNYQAQLDSGIANMLLRDDSFGGF